MESPESKMYCPAIAIPEIFHSFQKEAPFAQCLICQSNLLADGVHYMIEKIYKGAEVIIEHAICFRCCMNKRQDLSQESQVRIEQYFEQHVDMNRRRLKMLQDESRKLETWLSHCIITQKSQNQVDEYQIYAHCNGAHLLFSGYPFMVSGSAIEQLQKLLSQKTKDCLEDFIGEYHGLPGEFIYDNGPLVLI